MKNNADEKITLAPAEIGDAEFIEQIFFSTRRDEFALLGWSGEQLKHFLRMQHDFQKKSYAAQFPANETFVVKAGGKNAGSLIVWRSADAIRLVDIALMPEFRGRGIGRRIIENLITEAEASGKKVTLSVLRTNEKAFSLYRRLGFAVTGEDDVYLSMAR